MNQVEKADKPIPKVAEHRISDLFSETSSPAAKGNAARWYAEMFIDLFLGQKLKAEIGEAAFRKLSLGELIERIRNDSDPSVIRALHDIKSFGDKASHYEPGSVLTKEEAERIVRIAIDLVVKILVDDLKRVRLDANLSRARIFSILFPGIREKVLSELINMSSPLDEYNQGLLHKYCLACTKNNRFNKARRKLDELLKKGFIEDDLYRFEIESIKEISRRMRANELPVPRVMEDVARNFNDVISTTPEAHKNDNARLASILEILVKDVFPSDMSQYVGDQIFIVDSIQSIEDCGEDGKPFATADAPNGPPLSSNIRH